MTEVKEESFHPSIFSTKQTKQDIFNGKDWQNYLT